MVMSKVSKAIAASFLCLTINAGGATNAMEEPKIELNMVDVDDSNMAKSENKMMKMKKMKTNVVETERKEKKEETDNKKNDDDDDDNKDKKTDIWKILIPVFAGVGGLIVGTLLGKFAF